MLDDDTWRAIGGHLKLYVFWLRRTCRSFYWRVFKDDELPLAVRHARMLVQWLASTPTGVSYTKCPDVIDETMRMPLHDTIAAWEAVADCAHGEARYIQVPNRGTFKCTTENFPREISELLHRRAKALRWCCLTDCDGRQLSEDEFVAAMLFFHDKFALHPIDDFLFLSTAWEAVSDSFAKGYTFMIHRAANQGLLKVLGCIHAILAQDRPGYELRQALNRKSPAGNNAYTWAQHSLDAQLVAAGNNEAKKLALKAKYHPVLAFFASLGMKNRPWRTETGEITPRAFNSSGDDSDDDHYDDMGVDGDAGYNQY